MQFALLVVVFLILYCSLLMLIVAAAAVAAAVFSFFIFSFSSAWPVPVKKGEQMSLASTRTSYVFPYVSSNR